MVVTRIQRRLLKYAIKVVANVVETEGVAAHRTTRRGFVFAIAVPSMGWRDLPTLRTHLGEYSVLGGRSRGAATELRSTLCNAVTIASANGWSYLAHPLTQQYPPGFFSLGCVKAHVRRLCRRAGCLHISCAEDGSAGTPCGSQGTRPAVRWSGCAAEFGLLSVTCSVRSVSPSRSF